MYAVIRWNKEGYILPEMNDVGGLRVFETLEEADKYANAIDEEYGEETGCRVISIDSVHE